MEYWHSICPSCNQGRLFVMSIENSDIPFLLCEECEYAWASPEEIDLRVHFDFQGLGIRRAEKDDIERAGWFRFALTAANES